MDSPNHRFWLESPHFRAYIVDTPITLFCDLGDASLWRIAGYSIDGSQALIRTALPLSRGESARASDRIESCSFRLSRRAAHWAARSGVEWALHEAVASSWLPGAVSTTLNLGGCVLSGFQVVVLCTETSHQHARRVTYESLDSLGSHFRGHIGSLNHIDREVQASVAL